MVAAPPPDPAGSRPRREHIVTDEERGRHLRALARVSRLLRRSEIREQLRLARSADATYAILAQEARPSAA